MSEKKKKIKYVQEVTLAIESELYLDVQDLAKALSEGKLEVKEAYTPVANKHGVIVLKEK